MFSQILLWFFFACGGDDNSTKNKHGDYGKQGAWSEEKSEPKALLVEYALVTKGQVSDQLETTGTLESIEQANIIPEANGTIQEIFVREGDQVNKGQALAVLINPSLDAGAERAEIELERAKREAQKADTLHAQGAISDREKQEAVAALQTAKSAFTEASKSKGFTTLRSPITGVVAFVDIREGELAGGARAFQVVNPTHLRIVASIPEQDLSVLSIGQTAVISATYDEEVQASAAIERIAPVVDPASGTVKVFINLEEGQTALRPGQFVRAQIQTDTHENVLTLPKSAIVYKDGEAIAYVIEEAPPEPVEENEGDENEGDENEGDENEGDENEGDEESIDEPTGPRYIATQRRLELGYIDAKMAEITSGLEENEQVITIGNAAIRDKSLVRFQTDEDNDEVKSTTEDADVPSTTSEAGDSP